MTTRTKKQIKENAQNELTCAMQTAFCELLLSEADKAEMSKQMARVEKLFGYNPYSFTRGV